MVCDVGALGSGFGTTSSWARVASSLVSFVERDCKTLVILVQDHVCSNLARFKWDLAGRKLNMARGEHETNYDACM